LKSAEESLTSPTLLSPKRKEKRAVSPSGAEKEVIPPSRIGKGARGLGPKHPQNIILGQNISPEKISRAKELRHDMTPVERKLWEQLRGNRLEGFHFRRQQVIGGYIVDFYCHAVTLIVEVDGEVHQDQIEYDQERDAWLSAQGFTILRFQNQEVESSLDWVLNSIRERCLAQVEKEE
jgi:very-short-patch-repair endonuclease